MKNAKYIERIDYIINFIRKTTGVKLWNYIIPVSPELELLCFDCIDADKEGQENSFVYTKIEQLNKSGLNKLRKQINKKYGKERS